MESSDALNLLTDAINRACKAGVYDLKECVMLFNALVALSKQNEKKE